MLTKPLDQGDATPAKDGMIRCRGMRFPRHADVLLGKQRRMLRTNMYRAKETDAALRIVQENDVVLELGGGLGYMSTLLASKRAVKSVSTFEPNPHLIPYIQKVHAANGIKNAEVTHALLGSRKGQADFFVRTPLLRSSARLRPGEVDPPSIKVDVLNAKSVIEGLAPHVLICDLQGAEGDLIPQLDLSSLRAAIVKIDPDLLGPDGVNALFSAFMAAGMSYYPRGAQGKVLCFNSAW